MYSDDLISFSHAEELIKQEFLSSQAAINSNSSSNPVSRKVNLAHMKNLKFSYLLATGLAKNVESLSERIKREIDVASRR